MLTTFVPPNVLQIGIVEKLDPSLESLARRFRLGWGFEVGVEVKGGLAAVDVERRKRRVKLERSDETLISVGVGEKFCRTECGAVLM
jgi:hypothetical protein